MAIAKQNQKVRKLFFSRFIKGALDFFAIELPLFFVAYLLLEKMKKSIKIKGFNVYFFSSVLTLESKRTILYHH